MARGLLLLVGAAWLLQGCAPAVASPAGAGTPRAGRPATALRGGGDAPTAGGSAPAQPPGAAPAPDRPAAADPGPAEGAPPPAGAGALPEVVALCPAEMTLAQRPQGPFCIDRWEASIDLRPRTGPRRPWPHNEPIDGREQDAVAVSVAGRRPQGYVSGLQAVAACAAAGKRLCETDEWVRACRGPEGRRYPYGDERRAGVCNDRFKVLDHHPVPTLWKKEGRPPGDVLMWHPEFMNDPRLLLLPNTTEPAGAREGCVSGFGAFDMVGNLHEWVNDPEGTFRGGFFMDTFQNGEGCDYRTVGHGFEYHDYSTGFRCCADAGPVGGG